MVTAKNKPQLCVSSVVPYMFLLESAFKIDLMKECVPNAYFGKSDKG